MPRGDLRHDEQIDEFFQSGVWFIDFQEPVRLVGISIKVEPTGYLAVLKGITAEGPVVAFTGKRSLWSLCEVLRSETQRNQISWRPDKYALDKK